MENACPGDVVMDATRNDRDRIPARTGSVSPAVCPAAGWQVSGTSAPHASVR